MKNEKNLAEKLLKELLIIVDKIAEFENKFAVEIDNAHPKYRESVRNLVHYMAMRNFDNRKLQKQLSGLGLSSLGRSEAYTLATIYAVIRRLSDTIGNKAPEEKIPFASFEECEEAAFKNKVKVLGPINRQRTTGIMVTMPPDAATDYELVKEMIEAGMDIVRINCAHDGRDEWKMMVENIRKAAEKLQTSCKIVMDLGGPKIRTGELKTGVKVLKVKPEKDERGLATEPITVNFVKEDIFQSSALENRIPVKQWWKKKVKAGDEIRIKDSSGKSRKLTVIEASEDTVTTEALTSCYFETNSKLTLYKNDKKAAVARIGELPTVESFIPLQKGDILKLNKGNKPGKRATFKKDGRIKSFARISCTSPQIIDDAKVGERVLLDDGTIQGVIEQKRKEHVRIRILFPTIKPRKLRVDKGINFPDTKISISGLTGQDKEDLQFVVQHAEVVNVSFIRSERDVKEVLDEMQRLNAPENLGLMLKIETQQGFQQLPKIMMAAIQHYPVGIMIARGDLAIECGWDRMAEVQEEILWLCEAAHLPDVWATQVLENLAKTGLPSRAEITDAAMSQRADCVMLNKGPYIVEAIKLLDNIIRRMQAHQDRKFSMLRSLNISHIMEEEVKG